MNKGMLVTPDGVARIVEFNAATAYNVLSTSVAGYIECVSFERDLEVYVNEESKYNGNVYNPYATTVWLKYYGLTDMLMGTVVFTGGVDANGNTKGLTKARIEYLEVLMGVEVEKG